MSGLDDRLTEMENAAAAAWKAGDHAEAERVLREAWDLAIRENDSDWQPRVASGGVTIAQSGGQWDTARDWLAKLRPYYDEPGKPDASMEFLEATLDYDSGEFERAQSRFSALIKQYGKRPFAGEDPKYLKFATGGR